VESIKTNVAATHADAAFLSVCSAWTGISGAGANYARTPIVAPAAWTDARVAAFWPVPAMSTPLGTAPAAKQRPVIETRKQTTVHQTQIGAGNGAWGPHPEREPAY
jgi:hypothetical protein